MHLLCPHCHNPIEVVEVGPREEVSCPLCGSSFRLEGGTTTGWNPRAGQSLGRFELIDTVGHGAFGTVYRARDPGLDRVVAIKVPRAGNLPGNQEMDRFLREARSVAQLRHPAIVPVHEVGQQDGLPYLVSDFVQGVTLADLLTARRPPPREAAGLIAAVADALQYAHQRGVVHRDVKPSNIMLGEDGTPHLMDFGLAKREAGEVTMTIDGQVLGTPAYMSPEQARGEAHQVDGRSDVYSLGVLLYQLVTGELPFRGNTRMLLHQVLHEEPRRPRSLNDRLPRDLETICLKAMAKEPSRRYQSAAELGDDLRRFLGGEPIRARPVGRGQRLWRWCRRNPALATTAGLAITATAAALVTLTVAVVLVSHSRDEALGLADANARLAKDKEVQAQTEHHLRKQAEWDAARRNFEHAYAECQREEGDRGVLWLTHSLSAAHRAGAADLEQSIRLQLAVWAEVHPLRASLVHEKPRGGPVVVTPNGKFIQKLSQVWAVAFSPDGKTVLTGSLDNTARLWEARTGKALGPPLQHEDSVFAVAFGPDGKTVLTGSWKTARMWEVATGKATGSPLRHPEQVSAVAFSPDGKTVLTGCADGRARLWEAATAKPLGPPLQHVKPVNAVAFGPDAKTVLTGSWKTARVWEVATGKALGSTLRHPEEVNAVAFSPDGKIVLTGCGDGKARLWEAATGKPLGPPLQHEGSVHAVAFSPDGKTVLTGSLDNTARLWEVGTGTALGLPLGHQEYVSAVAFSPDGKTVLTGCHDGRARLWRVPTGKALGAPLQHQSTVIAATISPDGKTVLTGCDDGTARLWDVTTGRALGLPLRHGGRVMRVAFSPDGKAALTLDYERAVRLWGVGTGKALGPPVRHPEGAGAAAFSPDGKTVLTGGHDGTARLWEIATGKAIGAPLEHASSVVVRAVAFHPDGKTVLTWGADSQGYTGRLWEAPARARTNSSTGADSQAYTARRWEVGTGKALGPAVRVPGHVEAEAFSPDGNAVLTGEIEGTARLWAIATGRPLCPPLPHPETLAAVAISRDGKTVLTGSPGSARLWDVGTAKPLGPPLQHRGGVGAVALSADGKIALTAGGFRRGSVQLWKGPVPLAGDVKRIELWSEVVTNMAMDDDAVVRSLDAKARDERLRRLQALGGPPVR